MAIHDLDHELKQRLEILNHFLRTSLLRKPVKFRMSRNITHTFLFSLLRSGFRSSSLPITSGETYSPKVLEIRLRSSTTEKELRFVSDLERDEPVTTPSRTKEIL